MQKASADDGFTQPAENLIAYLDRRDWNISDPLEQAAFSHILGKVSFLSLVHAASTARERGKPIPPATFYKTWLEAAPPDAQGIYVIWFNLGTELAAAGDRAGAATAYSNALLLRPDMHSAAVNLGLGFEADGKHDQALATWEKALQPDEARTALINHKGRLLEILGRFKEAEAELFRSLLINPHQVDAFTHWLHIRLKMCQWPVYGSGIPHLDVQDLIRGAGGLSILALFDDNALVNNWVTNWLARRMPPRPEYLRPEKGYKHDKIRVGYLSSDYCLHPISMLTAELFETHNRDEFEIYGYCSSPQDGSELRNRVINAFDKFTRIADMTDEQAARAIRADEIDILVDLNGLTEGTRMGVVRWRPAPVQLTYLGFVGSMPVPELDYTIADDFVVPPALAHDFHPKPIYMSRCYQVNDSKAPIGPKETREQVGLPTDKFVYCCFSNTYKITAEIFDCWMRILSKVENSVLWVLARNQWAQENMLARAAQHGVAADRLIFASPTSPATYMARFALADIFLDTYPYNSGTTASDALRMGLPMVTLSGKTFSSRMAGSLLRTMGAEEGIATSYEEYVERGIRFGTDPQAFAAFRDKLAGDAWRRTLGDTPNFVRELEQHYKAIRIKPKR